MMTVTKFIPAGIYHAEFAFRELIHS